MTLTEPEETWHEFPNTSKPIFTLWKSSPLMAEETEMKRAVKNYTIPLMIGIILGYLLHQNGLGTGIFAVVLGEKSQWFWAMTQTLIVLVSLLAIYQQVKLQRYSNMLTQLTHFDNTWRALEMKQYRKAVCKEYKETTKPGLLNAETELLNFFEKMGLYYKEKVVPLVFIWDDYGAHIENFWPMLEAKVKVFRESKKDHTYFENTQTLSEALLKYSVSRNIKSARKTKQLLDAYADQELEDLKDC